MRTATHRPMYYILDGDKRAVPVDVITWGFWFEDFSNRMVAQTEVYPGVRISTAFIGLDATSDGAPLLFETMAFRDGSDDELWRRYSTWEEATAGHAAVVARYAAPSN